MFELNTAGKNNAATGFEALRSTIGGRSNVASGADALYSNTFGGDNVATGSGALFYNTEGMNNVASGSGALAGNTIGTRNVGGDDAGEELRITRCSAASHVIPCTSGGGIGTDTEGCAARRSGGGDARRL